MVQTTMKTSTQFGGIKTFKIINMKLKLNVLLAQTDALGRQFKNSLTNYSKFFAGSQGAFAGEKKTYQPKEGTIDEPSKRGNKLVQTTVDEKFDYFIKENKAYINALFSQEATNAAGVARASLIVGGKDFGEFSSLELLRLKSLLEDGELRKVLGNIPVRSDSEEWKPSTDEMYKGRDMFETPVIKGVNVTTTKEDYILKDPNVSDSSPNYNAMVAQRTTLVELGDYTTQKFSGAWSQRQKAGVASRHKDLYLATISALKVCNEVEIVESKLTADDIFGYLLKE